jgi:Domain of unknown function (DUF4115)
MDEVGSDEIWRYRASESPSVDGGLVAKAIRVEAQLKPAQQVALGALASGDARDLTRARYEELTGVSRSQAAYDLAELVEAGLLVRIGAGRATRYRLVPASDSGRRRWTDDRIRAELAAFCAERATWPSAAEFRAAGHSDLYVAASRYGGIGFWAAELGFPRSERVRPTVRRRAALAIAAALVFALGAGTAGLALRMHRHGNTAAPPAKVQALAGDAAISFLQDVRSLRRARVAGAAARTPAPAKVALVLRASRGDSWISVRLATGRLVAERVLTRGTHVRLSGAAFRVQLGAAENVDLSANGSRLHPLPSRAAVVVVTRRGTRVAEWAPVEAAPQLAASHVSPSPPPAAPQAPAPKPKPAKIASPPPPPPPSGWPTPLPSP